jgi:hypothetical protein
MLDGPPQAASACYARRPSNISARRRLGVLSDLSGEDLSDLSGEDYPCDLGVLGG